MLSDSVSPSSPPSVDCGSLVPGALAGDQSASAALVEALYPVVIRVVRSHLPRSSSEDDVAQDVFLKVFAKLKQFRGDRPLEHWVSRIATNTCYDLLRRQRVRPLVRFSDLSAEHVSFLENSVDGSAALGRSGDFTDPATAAASGKGSLGREFIERLLATLNAREQLVLRLLDLEQYSVEEICNQTGWSASKVKVTAMRARKKLTKTLAHLEAKSEVPSSL